MRRKFVGKKFLTSLICILFLVLFAFLIIDGFFNLDRDTKIYGADMKDIIDQRTTSLLSEINIFPQDAGDDLLFLSKLSSLKKVIISEKGHSENNFLKDLENDFLEFLKQSTAYSQLSYIDEEGNEVVKVEFDGETYKIISKENLLNKKEIDYFSETINFDVEETFISELSLDSKKKVESLEMNRSKYIPIITSATPVFDKNNVEGIVSLSFYIDYFLEDIRRAQREGENVLLIDKEGYYLAHPNRKKEFAFMFDNKEDNFYKEYPEISKELLLDPSKRVFESEKFIFSFKYISSTIVGAKLYRLNEDYYWILVTVSDKTELSNTIKNLKTNYLYFLLFSGLIILVIIILVFVLVFVNFGEKNEIIN